MNLIELAGHLAGVITNGADAVSGTTIAIEKLKAFLDGSKVGGDPEVKMAIADLQTQNANAQATNAELRNRITELSAKLRQADTFQKQKQNYFLWDTGFDCMVLRLRQDAATGEPIHCICPDCAERGKKSILQVSTDDGHLNCHAPDCKGRFQISGSAFGSGARPFGERFPEDHSAKAQQSFSDQMESG